VTLHIPRQNKTLTTLRAVQYTPLVQLWVQTFAPANLVRYGISNAAIVAKIGEIWTAVRTIAFEPYSVLTIKSMIRLLNTLEFVISGNQGSLDTYVSPTTEHSGQNSLC